MTNFTSISTRTLSDEEAKSLGLPVTFDPHGTFDILAQYVIHRNDLKVYDDGLAEKAEIPLWGFIREVSKHYDGFSACYRRIPGSRHRALLKAVQFKELLKSVVSNILKDGNWDIPSLDLVQPDVARDIVGLIVAEIDRAKEEIEPDADIEDKKVPEGWDSVEPRSRDEDEIAQSVKSDEDDWDDGTTLEDLDGSWEDFGKQQEDDDSIPEVKLSDIPDGDDIPDEMIWDADVTRVADFGTQEYAYVMAALRFLNAKPELPELLEISADEVIIRAANAGSYEKIIGETIHELRMCFKSDYDIIPLYEKLVTGAMVIIARRLQHPDAVAYTVSFR